MEDQREGRHPEFRVIPHGPLHVSGNILLKGPDGKDIPTEGDVWLCRCGQSGNKPFCDGSHRKADWKG